MLASRVLHSHWGTPPTTELGYAALLQRAGSPDCDYQLVCRRADAAIVGFVNLGNITRGGLQSAQVGYAVGAPYAGAGYMTEGVGQLLARAFGELGLHRVEANIQPDNERSRALARRCGFRLEGFSPAYMRIAGAWRDHERWAILLPEWQALPDQPALNY